MKYLIMLISVVFSFFSGFLFSTVPQVEYQENSSIWTYTLNITRDVIMINKAVQNDVSCVPVDDIKLKVLENVNQVGHLLSNGRGCLIPESKTLLGGAFQSVDFLRDPEAAIRLGLRIDDISGVNYVYNNLNDVGCN